MFAVTVPFLILGFLAKLSNVRHAQKDNKVLVQTNHDTESVHKKNSARMQQQNSIEWSIEPDGLFEYIEQTTGTQC